MSCQFSDKKRRNSLAVILFVFGYTSFVAGLKLDGLVDFSWLLLLAPIWLPSIFALIIGVLVIMLGSFWAMLQSFKDGKDAE